MKINLLSALIAFAVTIVACVILIPVLRKWKAGQNILSYVKEHKNKAGTPTMGGLTFVLASVLVCVIFTRKFEKRLVVTLSTGLAYMLVGLLDDFLKCKRKENLGLTAWQKTAFQVLVAVFVAIYAYRAGFVKWYLPFITSTSTSWVVVRSPPICVSRGGVKTGVSIILMPCSRAVRIYAPISSQWRSE